MKISREILLTITLVGLLPHRAEAADDLSQLGFSSSTRTVTLFVEGVDKSATKGLSPVMIFSFCDEYSVHSASINASFPALHPGSQYHLGLSTSTTLHPA